MQQTTKGLSCNALKWLGVLFMTIDHIGAFIPGTPLFLRYIGRLASPLFFFCVIEGFTHTRSRKTYLLRMYGMAQLMTLIDILLPMVMHQPRTIPNNVFLEIFSMVFLVYLLTKTDGCRWKQILLLIAFAVYQLGIPLILDQILFYESPALHQMAMSLLGCSAEGIAPTDYLILVFWWCRKGENRKKRLILSFIVLFAFEIVVRVLQLYAYLGSFIVNLIGTEMISFDMHYNGTVFERAFITEFYWMMFLSLPLLLLYNGERGKQVKPFFYAYYPLHIMLLYCIGVWVQS